MRVKVFLLKFFVQIHAEVLFGRKGFRPAAFADTFSANCFYLVFLSLKKGLYLKIN